MLSIIIPTLNEEKYLPKLLESIKVQDFNDYEIIVADNNSTDRTVKIVQNYNYKITPGGLPARGRNEGAKIAQGEIFLFLDADVVLPEKSLAGFLIEFEKQKLSVATCYLKPGLVKKFFVFFYDIFYNFSIYWLKLIGKPTGMNFILVSREIHEKINGFDEEIKFGEDSHYLERASKFGKFGILKFAKVIVSMRRFEREGFLKTFSKYIYANIYMSFFGPIKKDIFEYKFGHYNGKKSKNGEN